MSMVVGCTCSLAHLYCRTVELLEEKSHQLDRVKAEWEHLKVSRCGLLDICMLTVCKDQTLSADEHRSALEASVAQKVILLLSLAMTYAVCT